MKIPQTILAVGLAMGVASSAVAAVGVGDRPRLNFQTTAGDVVTNEALEGRVVVLDFWATWCGPCVSAMPHMKKLNQTYASKGVQIIGISMDTDRGALDRFVKQRDLPWPQQFDGRGWKNAVAKQFGVNSIPRIYILSPSGQVVWTGHPSRMDKPLADAVAKYKPRAGGGLAADDKSSEEALAAIKAARGAIDAGDFDAMFDQVDAFDEQALTSRRVKSNLTTLSKKIRIQLSGDEAYASAREARPESAAKLDRMLASLRSARASAASAAGPAGPSAAVHPALAARKLEQAEAARLDEDHHRAYPLYRWLVEKTPDSDEGRAAAVHAAAYEADEAFMAEVKRLHDEAEAKRLLSLAKMYADAGKADLARQTYQQVLDKYPQAEACCEEATAALAAMQ